MDSFLQITFSFVITDVARVRLLLNSFLELPALFRVEMRYVKLSTSSNFCLLSMIIPGAVEIDLDFLNVNLYTINSHSFL